jgi:hypothetical protein
MHTRVAARAARARPSGSVTLASTSSPLAISGRVETVLMANAEAPPRARAVGAALDPASDAPPNAARKLIPALIANKPTWPAFPRHPVEQTSPAMPRFRVSLRGNPRNPSGKEGVTMTASPSGSRRMVTGLFGDAESAESAYQGCLARGYEIGEVNVVMSEDTRKRFFTDDSEITTLLARKEAEGGELGGPKGGRVEILVTIFAAVGAALALPALGFVVAGPIAAALAGAGAAGLAAGLIGALGDWGVPEERLHQYEQGIRDGGILMMVEARSDEDARQIEQEWQGIGGHHIACC